MTEPKRHHYVPRVFLERFAEGGALFVRRRDGRTFTTGSAHVAVETGFYDLHLDDGSTSKVVEHVLADIEGLTANVFRAIDESGEVPAPGSPDREVLAVYLALQYTRTPEQRERVLFPERLAGYLAGRELTRDLVAEYLALEHLRFSPGESEVQAAFDFATIALRERDVLTTEFAMDMMVRSIEHLVPVIDELQWTVEHERKGRLITSDTPLVIWRPPTPRDAFEGVGIGNAHEIRFPLDPAKQLVLSRRRRPPTARITSDRVVSCNLDMIAGCHRFIVGRPRFQRQLIEPEMKPHRPVLRFNTGPLYERRTDGTDAYKGEVLHTWVATMTGLPPLGRRRHVGAAPVPANGRLQCHREGGLGCPTLPVGDAGGEPRTERRASYAEVGITGVMPGPRLCGVVGVVAGQAGRPGVGLGIIAPC